MRKFLKGLVFSTFLSSLIVFSWSATTRADELTEVLREKGVITKEDWVRIKAEEEKRAEEQKKRLEEEFPVKIGYGKKGLEFSTRDGRYKTQIQWRFQFRYSYPFASDPDETSDLTDDNTSSFQIRRARMKVGGHGYQPWLKYYFEYDFPTPALLDWRVMIEKYKGLQLRVGQWKVNYNRERVDSSGKQQFVERSIVNSPFTLDRQQGVMVYGHLLPGTLADSWYYAGVFNGTGRGQLNDDENMMYMGRLQWNFLGRDLRFSQSDVEFHERPAGSIAGAGSTNITNCPRFNTESGCTSLGPPNNLLVGANGQYRIDQMMVETAFKYRGFSLQNEYHWKQIKNSAIPQGAPGFKTNLMGSYVETGYFFHYLFPWIPRQLEFAFRYAFVDPNVSLPNDARYEYSGVLNWFIAGHRNKITVDTSRLELAQPGTNRSEQRVRLQWDISF